MTLLDTQTGGVTTPATVGIPSATSTTSAPVTPLDVKTTPAPAPANTNAVKSSVNQGGVTPSGLVIKADGSTIDYAASATNLQNKQADLSKQASALGGQNTTTIAPTNTTTAPTVVSSSAPVVANEQKTTADVSGLNADNATTTQGHNDYLAQLDAQGQALEARRLAETESINKQFDASKASTVDAQNRETGTFSSTLARIGGYLGDSASASGAMVNLNQQHQFQLNDLESKRQSAIAAANIAITDKQFALASLKANEAKDYAKQIQDNKQRFFDDNLKILNEQRQQDEANRIAIKDKLTNLAYLKPDQISSATKSEIDKFYGTPGFTDNYIAVTNQAQQAKSQKELMDARKATLEFLQNIPAGQKVTMPDGTEYTGMGKAGDVVTFMQVDSSGSGHLITYNKLTGAKSITNLGVVGKASGNGGSQTLAKTAPAVVDNAVAIFQTSLEKVKDKTGQYDPDIYLQLRNQLKQSKYPQLVPYMDKLFLDKKNQFFSDVAINRLRSKGVFFEDTSLPADNPVDQTGNDVQAGQ